jgi:hypothetical protein
VTTTIEWADALLSFEDLQRASTLERPKAVARWLQRLGVAYSYDAQNRPIALVSSFGQAMARKSKTKSHRSTKHVDEGFNLEALG